MPNKKVILTDYEPKKRPVKKRAEQDKDTLTHQELEAPMVREFAIHIL
jgi:hypothetical protein